MKYQKLIATIVVLSAMFCFVSSKTTIAKSENGENDFSGKCAVLSFDDAYSSAKAVFIGKVLSESKSGDVRTFEFEVEKYWKGADKKKIEINVYETMRYQARFQKDGRYLIYANANSEGNLSVGRCSRSREAEDAGEDLTKLGTGKMPK